MINSPIFSLINISKKYEKSNDLSNISLELNSGKIHCLLAENEIDKINLLNIISGRDKADSGSILLNGSEINPSSPRQALKLGISTIYRDTSMFPLLSISRNFFIGREPSKGFGIFGSIDIDYCNTVCAEIMLKYNMSSTNPEEKYGSLNKVDRFILLYARAIYFSAKLIIFDEPIKGLTVSEISKIMKYINQACSLKLGVLFISQSPSTLLELKNYDNFTILKDGSSINVNTKSKLSESKLLKLL